MRRQMMILARRADQCRRIAVDLPFLPQVFPERANRGKFPRRRRSRVAALVQISKKRADVGVHEVGGRQVGTAPAEMGRQERQELRHVALVRANGVRRGVVVEGEVLEIAVELFLHRVGAGTESGRAGDGDRPAIQSSSAVSARSAYASLRSPLFFGTRAPDREVSAGMMPKVMLVGS